jgi:hypothetical protein
MKLAREGDGLAIATLAWSAAWCGDLLAAWRHAPYDRLGCLAAAGWLGAVVVAGSRATRPDGRWLVAAWMVSFVGVAGDLNVARHAALAAAGAAWVGGGRRGWTIVGLAVFWMPALGWAGRSLGADAVNSLRVFGALACAWFAWKQKRLK